MTILNMENDAIFLPGKIHGCEDELYIIYKNEYSNNGNGSIEIQVIDYKTILELYDDTNGDYDKFFELMPGYCKGYYADAGINEEYEELYEAYPTADFIMGRDGGTEEEFNFIIQWAKTILKMNENC